MEATDMTNKELSLELSQFDEDYEQAEVTEFKQVPDGKYQVTVNKAEIARSTNSGSLMLKWDMIIIAGPLQGQHLFRNNMMASAENMKWLKKDLVTLEVKLKPSELPGQEHILLDMIAEVQVKNSKDKKGKDQQSVYIQKKLDIDLPPDFKDKLNSKDGFSPSNIESGNADLAF